MDNGVQIERVDVDFYENIIEELIIECDERVSLDALCEQMG